MTKHVQELASEPTESFTCILCRQPGVAEVDRETGWLVHYRCPWFESDDPNLRYMFPPSQVLASEEEMLRAAVNGAFAEPSLSTSRQWTRWWHVLPPAIRTYPMYCWCAECVEELGYVLQVMVTRDDARRTQSWGAK